MAVKTIWIDPNTGKEYSYNWGFDVDSNIPEKKNPVDNFSWMVNAYDATKCDRRIKVELVGIPNARRFSLDMRDLERSINNRMNNEEGEKNMNPYEKLIPKSILNSIYGAHPFIVPRIKKVVFNPPATIVFWTDDTKTVVKCQNNEEFDPEKGITMAFFKKTHGNKGHYFEEIKKWCYKGNLNMIKDEMHEMTDEKIIEVVEKGSSNPNPKWHIWYRTGLAGDIHCYDKDYSSKSSAVRRAKKMFANTSETISWTVSKKAPFGPESDKVEWHYN